MWSEGNALVNRSDIASALGKGRYQLGRNQGTENAGRFDRVENLPGQRRGGVGHRRPREPVRSLSHGTSQLSDGFCLREDLSIRTAPFIPGALPAWP